MPLLAQHFLEKYARTFNKEAPQLSSYAMEVLMNYDFPGNVRELENIIERGVALSTSNLILPESLTLAEAHSKAETNAESTSAAKSIPHAQSPLSGSSPTSVSEEDLFDQGLEKVITNLEKECIERALVRANQSKMKAAELLKISFRSLRYKIKKYNID